MADTLDAQRTARIVLLGRQGSGKGEQSHRLASTFGLDHISTGELLRTAVRDSTPLGRSVALLLERGELVPDDVVDDLVAVRLETASARGRSIVLDGYPRTISQCRRLAELLDPMNVGLAIPS